MYACMRKKAISLVLASATVLSFSHLSVIPSNATQALSKSTVSNSNQEFSNCITYHFTDNRGALDSQIILDSDKIEPAMSESGVVQNWEIVSLAETYGLLDYFDLNDIATGSPITKLDLARILVRLIDLPINETETDFIFEDCENLTSEEKGIIKAVHDAGVMSGSDTNIFGPDHTLTRASVITCLYAALEMQQTTDTDLPFSDVKTSHWYYPYISALYNLGIILTEKDVFEPDDSATYLDTLRWVTAAYEYRKNGVVHSTNLLCEREGETPSYFEGWNTQKDGTGDWYMPWEPIPDGIVLDLYEVWIGAPLDEYYYVLTGAEMGNGRWSEIVNMPTNEDTVVLPKSTRKGSPIAYWSSKSDQYYPAGYTVSIATESVLKATVVENGYYYAVFDGADGKTDSGSPYYADQYNSHMTSPTFNDIPPFEKNGDAVSGYFGSKTGTLYTFDDELLASIKAEADANGIACFTAQYSEAEGGYIQYRGNGSSLDNGANSYLQENIDFSNLNGTVFEHNRFPAPANKHFIGWNTQPDGDGFWYNPGDEITLKQNTVLYAQWGLSRINYHFTDNRGALDSQIILDSDKIEPAMSESGVVQNWEIVSLAETYGLLDYFDLNDIATGSPITKLDLARILVRLIDLPINETETDFIFEDCENLTSEEKGIIKAVHDAGVMSGSDTNIFGPDHTLTRASVITCLYAALEMQQTTDTDLPFSDVKTSHWYYPYISALYNLGIILTEKDVFEPDDSATYLDTLRWVTAAYEYRKNGVVHSTNLLCEREGETPSYFEGWNTQKDGTGDWYMPWEPIPDGIVLDLYEVWIGAPLDEYYYVLTGAEMGNGRWSEIVNMPTNEDTVVLPKSTRKGSPIAYWSSKSDQYYPAGYTVSIATESVLKATVVENGYYYAVFDGADGKTKSGSPYYAVQHNDRINSLTFNDISSFEKNGEVVSGYLGLKTGTTYAFNDELLPAIQVEADADGVAWFTAQYSEIEGGYIQYRGNGSNLESGANSYVQGNLDFSNLTGAVFEQNMFPAPANKHFIGWNTQPDGEGLWYDPGDKITLTQNTVLYAQWGISRVSYHFIDYRGGPNIELSLDSNSIEYAMSSPEDAYGREAISLARSYGLLKFFDSKEFASDTSITRLDLARILVQLASLSVTESETDLEFEDCKELSPEEKGIVKAVCDAGIMGGIGQDHFSPYNTLTRASVITCLYTVFGGLEHSNTTPPFSDVEDSAWYYSYITTLYDLGIIITERDVFEPNLPATYLDALRWAVAVHEYKETGTVNSTGLLCERENESLSYFEGWNTELDGSGDWYLPESSISEGSILELYEVWTDAPLDGHYYVLTGAEMENGRWSEIIKMDAATSSIELPVANTFYGWYREPYELPVQGFLNSLNDNIFAPGETIIVGDGEVFSALSVNSSISVTYHENVANSSAVSQYVYMSPRLRLKIHKISDVFHALPEGKIFVSWNTAADGSGITYSSGEITDTSLELFAQWNTNSSQEPAHPTDSSSDATPASYRPIVKPTKDGSIIVSPRNPEWGDRVTIRISPDDGYALEKIIIYDRNGDRLNLERVDSDEYIFIQPRGRVTIEATFEKTDLKPWPAPDFLDVNEEDWFYDAVAHAVGAGLMSGISEDKFAPNNTLTRAMVAQILYSLEGKPSLSASNLSYPYTDVDSQSWYPDAVYWVRMKGYLTGYSDEQFGPNDPVTRQQLAQILYKYAKTQGYDITSGGMVLQEYSDYDAIADWAVVGMDWAVEFGLISGIGDKVLAPTGSATRAQVAQIFMSFLENVAK